MSEVQSPTATVAAAQDIEAEAVQSCVEKVSQLPQVEAVLKMQADKGTGIWTAISQRDQFIWATSELQPIVFQYFHLKDNAEDARYRARAFTPNTVKGMGNPVSSVEQLVGR